MATNYELNALERIATAVEKVANNTKVEPPEESMLKEIKNLEQIIRNFGVELQTNLDNPPSNGMEMARRMRELASRMTSFGIPPMFVRGDKKG